VRIRVIFQLKNKGAFLPFHHQHLLAQLIKGLLLVGGEKKYFHFDHYHFSGLKGQTKISRQGLHYLSFRTTLVISSGDEDFMRYLLAQIFSKELIQLGNLQLQPHSMERELVVENSSAQKLICISPIILSEPIFDSPESKAFISPEKEEFSDLLFESTVTRFAEVYNLDEDALQAYSAFQIVPDMEYIKKLNEAGKKFARIYSVYHQDVRFELRGYTFPFTLYATEKMQEFIFYHGLGALPQKGYGMIDRVDHDKVVKTEPFEL
jgi:CRISPR-associated endoribonuclease Cas6